VTVDDTRTGPGLSPGKIVLPLVLCQFIASYAGSAMNVAISSIAKDLGTTVSGVQTAITLFTLTMAALMIPGSKLTDIWGRKRCFLIGLVVYGGGALVAAAAQSLPVLIVGYSLLEGIGSALMIPPIYIIITVLFDDLPSRARSFGQVSAAAGIGAAAGPLIGGLITTSISWRASFVLQAGVVAAIFVMASRIKAPTRTTSHPGFDVTGAVLSAAGLFLIVLGVLQSRTYGWFTSRADFTIANTVIIPEGGVSPVWLFVVLGAAMMAVFFWHVGRRERAGKPALVSASLFRNRISNLGLGTQNIQWLVLQGSFFVISVFMQEIRGLNAVKTGLALTPATVGILASSAIAGRLAKRYPQRTLIIWGFAITTLGMIELLAFGRATSSIWTFVPGLFLMGVGIGAMLTSSVNVVQSAFPESEQGEISGVSRSVSNLGSSLGTAIVGSVLVSSLVAGNKHYALAMAVLVLISAVGFTLAVLLPRDSVVS
jgi:MFS family permease